MDPSWSSLIRFHCALPATAQFQRESKRNDTKKEKENPPTTAGRFSPCLNLLENCTLAKSRKGQLIMDCHAVQKACNNECDESNKSIHDTKERKVILRRQDKRCYFDNIFINSSSWSLFVCQQCVHLHSRTIFCWEGCMRTQRARQWHARKLSWEKMSKSCSRLTKSECWHEIGGYVTVLHDQLTATIMLSLHFALTTRQR